MAAEGAGRSNGGPGGTADGKVGGGPGGIVGGEPGGGSGGKDAILEAMLEALEAGTLPDVERIKLAFPGHEATVVRLQRVAANYRRFAEMSRSAPPEPQSLAAGTVLGDYQIDQPLARGGTSIVYRAKQRSLGERPVALKVLSKAGQSPRNIERFRREAGALAALHDRCLAEVYGFGETDEILYYAMELVDGPTLRDVLENVPRRAHDPGVAGPAAAARRRLVRWAADIAQALSVIHAAGLMHRDVKPSNIVIRGAAHDPDAWSRGDLPEGRAVLVDYGLVRPVVQSTLSATSAAGTLPYAPHEQLTGSRDLDARADIFALGVTLHDLLTGRLPDQRPLASSGVPPLASLAPDIDRDLDALVRAATEHDREWRYADGAALHADLQAWLDGRAVSVRRLGIAARARRWVRRHPATMLRVVAIGLAAVVLMGMVGWVAARAADASRARVAASLGDVATAAEAASGVPRWLAGILLRDPLSRDLLDQLDGADTPVTRIVAALARGDRDGALFEAVTALRANGFGSSPLLRNMLVAALSQEDSGSNGATGTQHDESPRHMAVLLAARLFHERPVESRADIEETEDLHSALRRLWEQPDLARDDRQLLLTALSGVSTPEDLDWIVPWALSQPRDVEERRLGAATAERITLRCITCGTTPLVDARLWDALVPELALLLADEPASDPARSWSPTMADLAVLDLGTALLIALDARGIHPDLDQLMPRASLQGSSDGKWLGRMLTLCAAARDPTFVDLMQAAASTGAVAADSTENWSIRCGMYGSDDLICSMRERCLRVSGGGTPITGPEAEARLRDFDHGVEVGRALRAGRVPDRLPDGDSLLGATETYEGADLHPQTRVIAGLRATRSGRQGPDETGARGAIWDFTKEQPLLSGSATSAEGLQVQRIVEAQQACWVRFGRFGESELRLRFTVPDSPGPEPWPVTFRHVSGSRIYYPYQGQAVLALTLDGWEVAGRHAAAIPSGSEHHFELPAERLPPGEHELRIRLHRNSTTTYRLECVVVGRDAVTRNERTSPALR